MENHPIQQVHWMTVMKTKKHKKMLEISSCSRNVVTLEIRDPHRIPRSKYSSRKHKCLPAGNINIDFRADAGRRDCSAWWQTTKATPQHSSLLDGCHEGIDSEVLFCFRFQEKWDIWNTMQNLDLEFLVILSLGQPVCDFYFPSSKPGFLRAAVSYILPILSFPKEQGDAPCAFSGDPPAVR